MSHKPKPVRLLGALLFCALLFPVFGQENVIQRIAAPLTTPLQSVLSPPSRTPLSAQHVNSTLPGLGTLPSNFSNEPAAPPVFAGSLELLPPETVYTPSIYVEGQGYLPLTHPSIQPYIDPAVLQNPAADPAVVMIPTAVSRQLETTGKTTLSLALEKENEPIVISAQTGWHKQIGTHEVYFLRGDCSLRQGKTAAHSPEAVVWIGERNPFTNIREVMLYLESNSAQVPISVEQTDSQRGTTKITDQKWLGHWYTRSAVDVMIAAPPATPPQGEPAIFQRAVALMGSADDGVAQTQYLSSTAIPQLSEGSKLDFRQIHFNPRSDNDFSLVMKLYDPNDPARGGIAIFTGGINLIIEGIAENSTFAGYTVDISADNAVIWAEDLSKISSGGSYIESDTLDFELYLEGNIIFREGSRVIEASRVYYDAKHKVAYFLDSHLSAPISDESGIEGSVRLKADILRQMGDGLFTARNAMVTTSQLGEPAYSLRSQSLKFDRRISQSTGKLRQVVVAENNYIAVRNLPVFYWPWIATDVEVPTFFLKNFSYGTSGRNGHTVKTLWDPFQIFNIRRPDGVNGDVNVTWMEKRGVGHGANFKYDLPRHFQHKGSFIYWGIYDRGLDQIGGERDKVDYPHSYRYRLHWIHQQKFNDPWLWKSGLTSSAERLDLRAEIGKVSDRNFLNSYFNSAWHNQENATTAIDLTSRGGNKSFGLSAEYALDNFYSNANWLPRLDHYMVGQSLFSDYFTWHEHTRVGLVDYHSASAPSDPIDALYSEPLPWEGSNSTGFAFSTRHELDLPIQAGAVKVIPYVLGDLSVWGKDQDGNAADRLYGQWGVRMNLPIWKVNPKVASRTWYLNGLAHKIDLDAEYMYGQASHHMDNLILTDPLDQWSVDDFRRRYLVTNSKFGGDMLPQFDPRYYALRSGMARNVTAGNMEIADDMQMFRLGMTHRFQTKRGSVGNRHILDWITVSTHMNLYPQASHHNFGQGAGLFDYNVLWHVGDRFSLFTEGLYDFFDDGQNLTRLGGVWNRPDRGSIGLTLDQFSGVVERTYLSLSIGYNMNEKYSMSYMTSYDLRGGENVGHNFMFVRTGESFRLLLGVVYSEALSEWSFSFGLEPVFLRRSKTMF